MSILNNGIASRTLYRIQNPPLKGGLSFDNSESTTLLECGHSVKIKNMYEANDAWCPVCSERKSKVK